MELLIIFGTLAVYYLVKTIQMVNANKQHLQEYRTTRVLTLETKTIAQNVLMLGVMVLLTLVSLFTQLFV